MSITSNDVIEKQTSEVINVGMDFSTTGLIGSSVVISNPSGVFSPNDGNLELSNFGVDGQHVTLTISGGIDKQKYRINIYITCSDSQQLEGDGILYVRNT